MSFRRSRVQHHSEETGIDLAPMLDFVLNLLIFFIITAVFSKEIGLTVSRPSATNAEKKEAGNIVVAIDSAGDIWIEKRRIDVRAVRANIERLHAQKPDDTIIVAAEKEAHTNILVQVIDQVRQGGVQSVSIAATERTS